MFLGKDDSTNINGHIYLLRFQEQIIKFIMVKGETFMQI